MVRRALARVLLTPKLAASLLIVPLALVAVGLLVLPAHADKLGNRSLTLTDYTPSHTAMYEVSFVNTTPATIGSIDIQFCANDPLPEDACVAPAGMDASGAQLTAQSGIIGFSVSGASTANNVVLTRTAASEGAGTNVYDLSNIVNPNAAATYYARVQLYSSTDASGTAVDAGGLAFLIINSFNINAEVPPYITACSGITISSFDCSSASGSYLNLGSLAYSHVISGQSQLLVATNAQNGYSVFANGSTLTSGNNIIPALPVQDVSRPGVSQFGLNLRANTDPVVGADAAGPGSGAPTANYAQPDRYMFVSNDVIAHASTADDYRKYSISYIANVSKDQPVGVYATTLTYVSLANF